MGLVVSTSIATHRERVHAPIDNHTHTTPADAGLLSATDEEHLAFAHSSGHAIVTHDDYISRPLVAQRRLDRNEALDE